MKSLWVPRTCCTSYGSTRGGYWNWPDSIAAPTATATVVEVGLVAISSIIFRSHLVDRRFGQTAKKLDLVRDSQRFNRWLQLGSKCAEVRKLNGTYGVDVYYRAEDLLAIGQLSLSAGHDRHYVQSAVFISVNFHR